MKENMEELISSININQVLVAILEEHKKIIVPTMRLLDCKTLNKDLIIDYDEKGPSFTFSLREVT